MAVIHSGCPKSDRRSVASHRTEPPSPGGGAIMVRPTGVEGSGRRTT